MNESKSPLLDEFIYEFGKDVVLGLNGKTIIPISLELIKQLYMPINRWLFDSKLSRLPIVMESNDEYRSSNVDHAMLYQYSHYIDNGKYMLLQHNAINPTTKEQHYPPRIIVSPFIFKHRFPFIFIVNSLAHEMIHQYTIEIGNELQS